MVLRVEKIEMKQNKGKIAGYVLLYIGLLILLILIRSADWLIDNFGDIDFSVVIYQIFSPLKGTGAEVLRDYICVCLYQSIVLSLIFVLFFYVYNVLLKQLVFEFDIHIWKKDFYLKTNNRFRLISTRVIISVLSVVLIISVCSRAVSVGAIEYIEDITHVSNLYETEYVSPDTVSIEFPEEKRNLLFIYLESMETTFASVGAGGGKPVNYIPELTRLAQENVSFSNRSNNLLGGAGAYPGVDWTIAALLGSMSGVNYKLPVGANDSGNYEKFLPGLIGMGDILEAAGYHNYFMCGSDIEFCGRLGLLSQHGNYHIWDYNTAKDDGIIPRGYYVFWGMEDKYLYEYAEQELTKVAERNEPFNFMMLTVDTHHPEGYICDLCENAYPEQYANAIACSDRQIGRFIRWVQEQDWYENTTIILTGDHLSMNNNFWQDIENYDRRIYNCFINLPDGLDPERTAGREFSIMDMFPTTLAAINAKIEGERLGLGTNLFSAEQTLPEKKGQKAFIEELKMYSDYYYKNFIIKKRSDIRK